MGGTKFGLIQTIAQAQEKNNRFRENNGNPNAEKRQFDLDLSEDIRRRKEERDQKTRQAVEEMDQAVRAGLRQKEILCNGEPLVGSPQWLGREKAKQTESKGGGQARKRERGSNPCPDGVGYSRSKAEVAEKYL